MASMLNNVVQLFTGQIDLPKPVHKPQLPPKYTERDLLRMESAIGRELFGPVPEGHQREFFCLDNRTWIWYENWTDPVSHKHQESTTRYEIHANGIIKIQEDEPYKVLEGQELKNLQSAVKIYYSRVMGEIYGQPNKDIAPAAQVAIASATA